MVNGIESKKASENKTDETSYKVDRVDYKGNVNSVIFISVNRDK